jgi:hypothetical protein
MTDAILAAYFPTLKREAMLVPISLHGATSKNNVILGLTPREVVLAS